MRIFDTMQAATTEYLNKWQKLIKGCNNYAFLQDLKPVAIGWKVADAAEYQQLYAILRSDCDRIIETWMNGRWIAKMHLKDQHLPAGISIIKLMQRRPGSSDTLGLDHLYFYSAEATPERLQLVLEKETSLKWSTESNDVIDDYNWFSIWFDGTEAKIKDYTVTDIVIKELQAMSQSVKVNN